MKKSTTFPLILAVLTGFMVFVKPHYGWKLNSFLNSLPDKNSDEARQLISENETLKTELAKLRIVQSELPEHAPEYAKAMVYSHYPMNFKNELLVNVGEKDGVAPGVAVVFGGILIGEVEGVFYDTASVVTVFDSRFKIPVRIGNKGAQALLRGGSSPEAALIPLNAEVAPGDAVFSASSDFPYGLPIGEVGDVKISADQLFKEALLKFNYDINSISAVLVRKTTNK